MKKLQILNSTFAHSNHGVALELKGTNAQIQNVYFQSNLAFDCRSSDTQCCRVGGAMRILNRNSTVKIVSSIFIGNQALSGGAIFSNGQGNTIVVNSTFRENKAICNKAKCYYGECRLTNRIRSWSKEKGLQLLGGAVTAYYGDILMIFNSTFIRNQANTSGGAVYIMKICDGICEKGPFDKFSKIVNEFCSHSSATMIALNSDLIQTYHTV